MGVLIGGGGIAGLAAAYSLPSHIDAILLEKEERVGGLLRTDSVGGFLFDHGPHLFFHKSETFLELFNKALGKENIQTKPARTGQISFGKLIDFPYAVHLNGLPADVVARCVSDFADRQLALVKANPAQIRTYQDYCLEYFGEGFTNHFMIPYAEKIWTVHPKELDIDWMGGRIVLPQLRDVIEGSIKDRVLAANYIRDFKYPMSGGSETFVKGVRSLCASNVRVREDSEIIEVNPKSKSLKIKNGEQLHFSHFVSSLPLPEVIKLIPDAPNSVVKAANSLRSFGVLLLNFASEDVILNPYQWIYFDGPEEVFHRIHYPSKLTESMAPDGGHSIQVEISFSLIAPYKELLRS